MLFSDPSFFLFFLLYFPVHYWLPAQYRLYLIILGSTIFYAWWKVEYIWLPFLLIGIAHFGTVRIAAEADQARKRKLLIITLVVLFTPLIVFKYTDFFYRDVFGPIFGIRDKLLDLHLPLGVSFITFTLTAYVVDIYRRVYPNVPAARTTTAYVLFFPHLIAGPILRPNELIPQLERPGVVRGISLIGIIIFTIGLVKKLVFADQIGSAVDAVYGQTGVPSAPAALLAIYGFSMQIYCDFSGYTDMAIGLALLIGVKLPNNFLRPYSATSIVEFWRRWHITLSFWLRDYLYIPLGGNRHGRWRRSLNMIITMVLGGLWHGASWTFVVWGFLHGVGIAVVHALRNAFGGGKALGMPKWLAIFITFHFVSVLWVFFRAPSLGKARQVLIAPFVGSWTNAAAFASQNLGMIILLGLFFVLHRFDDHRLVRIGHRRLRPAIIWPGIALLWLAAATASVGTSAKFIYFDF